MGATPDSERPSNLNRDSDHSREDPKTIVGLLYRLVSDKSCTIGALTLLSPVLVVVGLLTLLIATLIAASPTVVIVSAVTTIASSIGTLGLIVRLVRRARAKEHNRVRS
jgi:hypothetical protein